MARDGEWGRGGASAATLFRGSLTWSSSVEGAESRPEARTRLTPAFLVLGVLAALSSSLVAAPVAAQESTREVWPFFEGPDAHTWFVNDYDSRFRFTCPSDDSTMRAWAIWSWPDTPAGRYRVEVYVPPQEATAIVTYRIGTDSSGLIADPVRLNQLERSGTWGTIFDGDYAGGRLWVELGDHDSEPSGGDDWCRWGGHRSIGAGPARLVVADTSQPSPSPDSDPPGRVTVEATGGPGELSVSWWADSGSEILLWLFEHNYPDGSADSETFDGWATGGSWSGDLAGKRALPGEHVLRVQACNEYGCGPWGSDTAIVTASPPPTSEDPTRDSRVEMSLGANNSGAGDCPYSQLPCRWVDVTLHDLPAGSYPVRCMWLHSESGAERVSTSRTIEHAGGASATLNNVCHFNVRVGRSVHVTVGDVRSNTVSFTGDPVGSSTPSPPPPPPPVGEPPGAPRLTVRIEESSDGRTLVATWLPPSDDGGSPITGYEVTITRPGRTFGPYDKSASARSHRLNRLRDNTTYTVLVAAENEFGRGRPARESIRTPQTVRTPPDTGSEPPGAPRLSVRIDESSDGGTLVASWSPPANDGGSPITGYQIRFNTYDPPAATFGWYDEPASARSYEFSELRDDTTYAVSVRAKNIHGTGPPAIATFGSCPRRDKFTTRAVNQTRILGLVFGGSTVVVASTDFRTVDGTTVMAGTQGGVVSNERPRVNLSPSGCSWITENAKVDQNAALSGNALVTGHAQVSHHAKVSGDAIVRGHAKVYGEAVVSDNAEVSGRAKVYGEAQVFENAKVSGDIVIEGDAKVYGNLELTGNDTKAITSGRWNGGEEFMRALEETHAFLFDAVSTWFAICKIDGSDVQSFINLTGRTADNLIIRESAFDACSFPNVRRHLADAFSPGWSDALPYDSGKFVTLYKLFKVANNVRDGESLKSLAAEVRQLYRSVREKCDDRYLGPRGYQHLIFDCYERLRNLEDR